ncbi:MAG: MFS transporter [Eubacteriales bacterium]|nr:MFS transporter [Eubacteriales bacterium]
MSQLRAVKRLTLNYTFIQSLYYMGFAAIFAFSAVYLRSKGFTSQQVGLTLALGNLANLLAQPLVANWVSSSKRFTLNQIALLFATLVLASELFLTIVPSVFLVVLLNFLITQMLMMILQTLLVSLSLSQTNQGIPINFGLARGIGSGAFAVISFSLGGVIENVGTFVLPLVASVAATLLIVFIQLFKKSASLAQIAYAQDPKDQANSTAGKPAMQAAQVSRAIVAAKSTPFPQFLKRYPRFFWVLAGIVLILSNHSIYWSYQINIAEHVGGNSSTLGLAAALAAGIEIPVMVYFAKLAKRTPTRSLLLISTLFFVLKATATLLSTNVGQFLGSQIFQIGAYALYLPAVIFYVNEIMDFEDSIKGQAYLAMASTLGGIIGNLVGGFLMDFYTVTIALSVALGLSIIGAGLVYFGIRPKRL